MLNFETTVDTVAAVQTKFVETFVTNKKIQADMIKLVEANADFAKVTYKGTVQLAETAVKNFNELVYKKA